MNYSYKNSNGFTLIELLISVLIVGILAAGALALINPVGQFKNSRDSQRKADLAKVQSALETYRAQQGGYPQSSSSNSPFHGTTWTVGGVTYLQNVPSDPSRGYTYTYYTDPSGSQVDQAGDVGQYCLIACMESSGNYGSCPINGYTNPSCPSGSSGYYIVTNP